ncbi:MAG: hypothetical protein LWW85_10080, partial [Marinilabiliales bacterium]|nr:hypothetical protein [Marinilabiliales bacterium]
QPRFTGWINLGGKRGPLTGVDSIGFRMLAPIGNPVLELRSVSLSATDPGDSYLGKKPVVDAFGQWNLGNFDGKVHSLKQLQREWAAEEALPATNPFHYSPYGGYLGQRVSPGGFFRTEKVDGRWWFVDPDGYLFLSYGADCVSPGGGGNVTNPEKRPPIYQEMPPASLTPPNSRFNQPSFGTWNLFRRYGDTYPEKSREMVVRRMDRWGLNTIGNWSGMEVIRLNKKPFMLQLRGVGIENGVMGLPDVYAPEFNEKVTAAIREFVTPFRDNPMLIGYFTGNEPSWLGQESRLCSLILEGPDRPFKSELKKQLAEGDTPSKRKQFIHNTFRIFLTTVNQTLKQFDPHHLNLGMRFGHVPEPEILAICKDVFDVFSFNCYDLYPRKEFMDRITTATGLPMIIGEYHFGTVDRGMAQSLWQVDSQKERGVAFRFYTEQAYAHPGLIGTAWFQWCDQDLTGRRDGENYNCGLVDVTDRPYPEMVKAVSATAARLFDLHSGRLEPISQKPLRARGHGSVPDLWEK